MQINLNGSGRKIKGNIADMVDGEFFFARKEKMGELYFKYEPMKENEGR